jgi:hypothetical protein
MLKNVIVHGSILVVLLCVIVFQSSRIRELNARLSTSVKQPQVASGPSTTDSRERKRLTDDMEAALKENQELRRAAESKSLQADGIVGRVAALKDVLQRLPEQQIPVLTYATEADWYAAADGPLDTPEEFRKAMAHLRGAAEARFAKFLQPALKAYIDANAGSFPTDVGQLQLYFAERVDPVALYHYKVVPADDIKNVHVGGQWAITQTSVIDSEFDSHIVIGPNGFGSYSGSHR